MSHDARSSRLQLELEFFANRLKYFRTARGWSQSDLARAVWGETTTKTGIVVAANRQAIAAYELMKSWPDKADLAKIAAALEVSDDESAPAAP